MKHILIIMALYNVGWCEDASWHGYIKNHMAFVEESLADETGKMAIEMAKRKMREKYGRIIAGRFEVAKGKWGYQVNFSGVKFYHEDEVKDGDKRVEVVSSGGYGEVFMDEKYEKCEINMGP